MSSTLPRRFRELSLAVALCCSACAAAEKPPASAATNAHNWAAHGLDDAETRFSKLTQITTDNVNQLGLVWSYDLQSTRGVEATPLVVDGVMYVTAPWSIVHAIEVRTGKSLWQFDPQVARTDPTRLAATW